MEAGKYTYQALVGLKFDISQFFFKEDVHRYVRPSIAVISDMFHMKCVSLVFLLRVQLSYFSLHSFLVCGFPL